MDYFLTQKKAHRTLYSKDCKTWNGINDKTVVLGRTAADIMLRAYSAYWNPRPALVSWNAEIFLKKLAESRGIKLRPVSHEYLPTGDGMLIGGRTPICIFRCYWCGPNPLLQEDLVFCETVVTTLTSTSTSFATL